MIPKIYILLFILCLTTVIGCKKKSFLSGPDKVDIHQFNPLLEITSVDSFKYLSGSPSPTIYSSNSSVNYLLDIDGDSNPDFKLTVEHWYQWVRNSSSSANYNFTMSISGIESSSEIASIKSEYGPAYKTAFYATGESINPKAEWENTSWFVRTGGSINGPQYDLSETQYIGIRIKKKSRHHYSWLKITKSAIEYENKLQIHSFGYNRSNGNDITAGQGE